MNAAVIIPFRDRGTDPLRSANLNTVLAMWQFMTANHGWPVSVVDDGRTGEAQFNRSRAYNRGAAAVDADVLIFTESDMLLPMQQIADAVKLAAQSPGLVVPFTERHEFGPEDSTHIRARTKQPSECHADVIKPKPRRTGAINVLSRETLSLIGQYDEAFEGNWWDDRSMHIAFDICTNPTQWIDGPSWHLYHLPGHEGTHLTAEDKAATARNKQRWQQYCEATTADRIRELTAASPGR